MNFQLYPAIDIRGGRCVRLTQGDYDRETVYGEDPLQVAQTWIRQGAEWLHVVDLDAARSGESANYRLIEELTRLVEVPVQVGGGVRDHKRLERLLEAGVSRVVIGSAALDDPAFVKEALKSHGRRIAIGIDARNGKVATHGWLDTSEVSAEELAAEMVQLGAETFVFTDISRDGTLSGANVQAVRDLARACKKQVIASGGVKSIDDLKELAKAEREGVQGAIIGKALYTGAIRLGEAMREVAGVRNQ
ncbi:MULTISPECIES: 1-(5-phosphoribosyl)-5-[(5-phosphoribosylamino)methylideneamino]imidazole-4-carboxamide isomerase [Thermoactinomyces]|jgi:phosphoribosylformimino-5-aminoimidazole carboxamide ribotide isomerase|uniref:1-(5-phosphoribosyl)-5-[(5-phosphoribosylamino)methylideneamino] imidazole-4-carboxamide isomerase n=1 Tax=Thermoactinomyces daqus TaxID=1329516 RepID=A0A7W2AHR6_9BACL|nr:MULTISPECIES: 1-(5-phosphoribosyl)-5-[(5-phosphoribosylamino)methylideneamino]imidazole-4-carboxamide isomerase [Thermoactinomyces]MBA4543031.1 1-(5-phosphoribosyl)-5-[(5-phosphoribosylamino)methylideneamino]imidazole-4-carboxamide isomerase [Thermoactinomyces daqus]MBH8598692.1 1-(5-phosphoribosyl)-5-[(5-phosphoribosylamino)methylideneamino]imidazole-4-carboxamide isomerase [Thermoactinomyces sp. CICC 10523]MBH8605049.1 1-(5-phosphoribosyl)-5-[(5-phosphoribosylamino)methylideneamino]imidazol